MASKKRTTARPKKIYTTRKWNGDDLYSWAVFKKGQLDPIMNGLDMRSARSLAQRLQREHDALEAANLAKLKDHAFQMTKG